MPARLVTRSKIAMAQAMFSVKAFTSGSRAPLMTSLSPSNHTISMIHLADASNMKLGSTYDRIPAVVELCIQAGVDLPEYPSCRRTIPRKKVIDRGGFIEEPRSRQSGDASPVLAELDTCGACIGQSPPPSSDVQRLAEDTLEAYETVRWGVRKLMRKYTVKACGYCSEAHVGPWGHNAKLCGELKHQWRDGKHGWQDATVEEVIPPNYVWHVRDLDGPPLKGSLKRFYGKAPAVVELCVQAGAAIPEKYNPMMRLNIIVPDFEKVWLLA